MPMRTWKSLIAELAPHPLGTRVRVARHLVEHPVDAGMHHTIFLPVGQCADYSMKVDECRALHVQDFGEHLEGYLFARMPLVMKTGDNTVDPISGAMAFGSLLGLAIGRSKGASLAGALAGALLGVALANSTRGLSEPTSGPATTDGTGMNPALTKGANP